MNSQANLSSPGPHRNARDVVACVISDGSGRVLVGQRPRDKRHGGLWEFPGGKVRPGETLAQAADRELEEELGVRVTETAATPEYVRDDPESGFRILFLRVRIDGEPERLEHEALDWVHPSETACEIYAPADAAYLRHIISTSRDSTNQ